jgi:hypothetical protein
MILGLPRPGFCAYYGDLTLAQRKVRCYFISGMQQDRLRWNDILEPDHSSSTSSSHKLLAYGPLSDSYYFLFLSCAFWPCFRCIRHSCFLLASHFECINTQCNAYHLSSHSSTFARQLVGTHTVIYSTIRAYFEIDRAYVQI